MRIIFVGNPGTGKSTILNGIIGDENVKFKSGVSYGGGMTSSLQWAKDDNTGYHYGDTPGLSDVKLRKEAAQAITEALKKEADEYKIIFVITEEAGRVRPVDVTTISTVLRALVAGKAVEKPEYGIIVNKVSKKKINTIKTDPAANTSFFSCLQTKEFATGYVHLYAKKEELEDEDDKVHQISPELVKFLSEVPSMDLVPAKVNAVNADSYEEENAKLESLIESYKNDTALMAKKHAEDSKRLAKEFAVAQERAERKSMRVEQEARKMREEQARETKRHNEEMARMAQERNNNQRMLAQKQEEFERKLLDEQKRAKVKEEAAAAELRGAKARNNTQSSSKGFWDTIGDGIVTAVTPWSWFG